MKLHARKFIISLTGITCLLLNSCGGGGGGGGGGTAARVDISLSVNKIDSGERLLVRTKISQVNPLGIMLKFKFPKALSYIPDTSYLYIYDYIIDTGPEENVGNGDYSYLVFFFEEEIFGADGQGELEFALYADGAAENEEVAVDADIDDPEISNSSEFNESNPNFSKEDAESIEVIDDA